MITSANIRRTYHALVVDDYEINRDALGIILEDDYEVHYAEDGVECMRAIEAHAEELSIILLDLIMPNMTGFEVLKAMRDDARFADIPVIVLTSDQDAELEALQLGAADFITKPFDMPEVILARVHRVIELVEGRQLISAAEHDSLTGLYTRSFFFAYVDRLIRYHPEYHMDAIEINIEQFHSVNALSGYAFGDIVLRHLARAIKDFLAETTGIASRIEADSFDLFCTGVKDYPALLERFQHAVDDLSPNVSIRLRMGVNRWDEQTLDPTVLFDRARTACNQVRGNYQSPCKVYDRKLRERELLHQRLLNDLRPALDKHQFIVYYQPKYDIQSKPDRLASAEALIRWVHPELGMISPGDFIPLFENKGLISLIDAYVWNEAAHQVARWRDRYGFTLPVSVNLSRSDIVEVGLIDGLCALINRTGIDYADLKLEVTESACTDNARQMLDVVKDLRTCGFAIEMDDFGSGYSSLNMLSDMPIDVLKMDMRFVRHLEESATDRKLVALILDIARYLGLSVVAEGVETEGQLDILREAGCDLVQGYYFSPPVPAERFEALIESEVRRRESDHS